MTVKNLKKVIKKNIITTAVLLSSIKPAAFAQSSPEKDDADSIVKTEIGIGVRAPVSKNRHQMGPGKLETGNSRIDEELNQMRKEGAFYLDYKKYRETKDVEAAVVYFTNEEIAEKGMNKIPISPFAVSLARENGVLWKGTEDKDSVAMAAYNKARVRAICNIDGLFYGEFQFAERAIAKAVLYGLVQRRNPELQKFCMGFVRPGVNLDTHAKFQKFRRSYLEAVQKFDDGEGTRQDLMRARFGWMLNKDFDEKPADGIFAALDYSKANFYKLSIANPLMSRQLQETYAVNVYMVMAVESEKIFNHLDLMTAGSVFASMIHKPNSKATRDILCNPEYTPEEICHRLITKDGKPTEADERMEVARKKAYNQGYYGEQFCRDFSWITDSPEFWEKFQSGSQKFAESRLKEKEYAMPVLSAEDFSLEVVETPKEAFSSPSQQKEASSAKRSLPPFMLFHKDGKSL